MQKKKKYKKRSKIDFVEPMHSRHSLHPFGSGSDFKVIASLDHARATAMNEQNILHLITKVINANRAFDAERNPSINNLIKTIPI